MVPVFVGTVCVFLLIADVCSATGNVTAGELKSLLGSSDVIVIDLRTNSEWSDSVFKVPRAVHEDSMNVECWAEKYPRDAAIVLYCA